MPMLQPSTLYFLVFPDHRLLKVGKANNLTPRLAQLQTVWGKADYSESVAVKVPKGAVFGLESLIHFHLKESRSGPAYGDGHTEMFCVESLPIALEHLSQITQNWPVQPVTTKGVPSPVRGKSLYLQRESARSKTLTSSSGSQLRTLTHYALAQYTLRYPKTAALLHAIICRCNEEGSLTIGQTKLSQILGVHERTVQRSVAKLRDDKIIEVTEPYGKGTVKSYKLLYKSSLSTIDKQLQEPL